MAKGNGYKLTQGEFAKLKGITQPMVARWIRQGKLEGAYIREGRRYKINPDKADAILATFESPAKAKKKKESKDANPQVEIAAGLNPGQALADGIITFAEAARREKLAKAALLELKLRRRRGQLLERQEVEAAAAKLATIVRVGIEAIPAKIAPKIIGLKKPAEVARVLQTEFKTVLNNLSKGIADLDL